MKFTWKLMLSVTTILSIIFSIAGIIMIQSNFKHALQATIDQHIEAHLLERYGIENQIVETISGQGEISTEKLTEYAKALISYLKDNRKFAIYYEGKILYANIEVDSRSLDALSDKSDLQYELKQIEGKTYVRISSSLEINEQTVTLLSMYPITQVFEENDRQLMDFYKLDVAVILITAFAISILAIFLTKPIVRLNHMSKKIAAGQYQERIQIQTSDEIGELTNSFNQMADTIEKKIEELKLSVHQREEFITNFTHELKNPMTSIIGYADLLRSEKYHADAKKKAAEYIFREAKRLEKLSHRLMALMGLSDVLEELSIDSDLRGQQNKHQGIGLDSFSMVPFMEEVYQHIQEEFTEVEFVIELEPAVVIADALLLEDCIRNLVDNARKAEPKDQKVYLLGKIEKEHYFIAVQDRGCGIPKNDLPRITESFYMVDKARARTNGGSGIGLALCEKIVQLHGGKLKFESELGVGTTVSFDLKLGQVEKEKC